METDFRDRLLALYRRFLGEPEREAEVYLGFALFFGGIVLGALGLALFLWSVTLSEYTTFFWQVREIAIVLSMLGLPAFVLSLVVLLPVDRRARFAAAVGGLLCLGAAGVFLFTYPENWNVTGQGADYSAQGIAVYASGLAVLAASTGAGLVAHRLEQARDVPGSSTAAGSDADGSAGAATASAGSDAEPVTDEQVREDIEAAMEETELTWGGVQRDDTKRLKIDTDETDIDRSGFDREGANTARSSDSSVDDAVAGLRKLQGGEKKEGTSEGVDEQTAALQQLREQQAADEDEEEGGIVGRLKSRLRG